MVIEPLTYLTDGEELFQFVMSLPTEDGVIIEDVRAAENITLTTGQFKSLRLKTLEDWRAELDG